MDETTTPAVDYSAQLDTIIQQQAQLIDYLDHMYKLQHALADNQSLLTAICGIGVVFLAVMLGVYIVRW
ncbi:hypothetical protein ACTID9_28700 (plasmid) [Brevibacillus fluminis]|uniref:hypothetical protein n=1 Tax=Brevibacillus fluminis TaxID=511487 RepID=UPI003F8B8C4C